MAMTLRLTDEEQQALKERAAADGVSMQDAARAAIREYVIRGRRHERLDKAADKILDAHAEALRRLGE
jgi:plasmid stability protein